ncbi:hypothetical protein ACHAXN_008181, partial [Cyclotella atomus]
MSSLRPFLASLMLLCSTAFADNIPQHERRILHNPQTGTITHPLIPHSVHLSRRRLEHNDIIDTSLPDRPSQSRHSISPDSNAIPPSLRSNSSNNSNNRSLQQQMGALYQGYGTHYIDLWVGSPTPQRQTVIVDTGSGVTAFPCEECTNCGDSYHTDSYFKESQSQTFRAASCDECTRGFCTSMSGGKRCKISMSYAEGSSWSAYESLDVCYAGGPHDAALASSAFDMVMEDHVDPVQASQFAFELSFGCQVSITGLFITQLADGIMGMENDNTAFWKQMYNKKAIPKPEFSLCFWRQDNADREGTRAGALTFGGVDKRLHASPMVFAENQKGSGFYAVHLKAIYLREGGGQSAQVDDMSKMHRLDISESSLNRGNVIVDSGTTDSYFTKDLASTFSSVWKQIMGNSYNHGPVSLTEEDIAALPTIIIVMQGHSGGVGDEVDADPNTVPGYVGNSFDGEFDPKDVVLAIPASHYMEFDPDTGKYVARFYTDESSGSVLGANAMMGHDIYFDTTNGRIGFAESDCDYNQLLLQEGKSISVPPEQISSTKTEVPESESNGENDDYDDEYDGEYEGDHEGGEEYDDDDEGAAEEYSGNKGSSGSSSTSPGKGGISTYTEIANEILDDMKHECSSAACRGVAAFLIIAAASFVLLMIRRTIARRRV